MTSAHGLQCPRSFACPTLACRAQGSRARWPGCTPLDALPVSRCSSHYGASTSQSSFSAKDGPWRTSARGRRRVVAHALFDPPPFQPEKLTVLLAAGTTPLEPAPPLSRKYTLTHNDITGNLLLTIGSDYNQEQISGFYTRLLRDEVVAEWVAIGATGYALHVYCHVSGEERWLAPPLLRNYIFRREMPLVLDTLVYAERQLLERQPELADAQVYVHFQSAEQELDTVEFWGVLGARGSWPKGPTSILLRTIYAVVGWPAGTGPPVPADLSVDLPETTQDVEAAVAAAAAALGLRPGKGGAHGAEEGGEAGPLAAGREQGGAAAQELRQQQLEALQGLGQAQANGWSGGQAQEEVQVQAEAQLGVLAASERPEAAVAVGLLQSAAAGGGSNGCNGNGAAAAVGGIAAGSSSAAHDGHGNGNGVGTGLERGQQQQQLGGAGRGLPSASSSRSSEGSEASSAGAGIRAPLPFAAGALPALGAAGAAPADRAALLPPAAQAQGPGPMPAAAAAGGARVALRVLHPGECLGLDPGCSGVPDACTCGEPGARGAGTGAAAASAPAAVVMEAGDPGREAGGPQGAPLGPGGAAATAGPSAAGGSPGRAGEAPGCAAAGLLAPVPLAVVARATRTAAERLLAVRAQRGS